MLLGPAPRHDEDSAKLVRKDHIGPRGRDSDRMVIGSLDRRDRRDIVLEIRGAGHRASQAEDDVLAREWRAIMEPDTAAQIELPGGCVDQLPSNGERCLDLVLGVEMDQRFIDL
jgi:hypothetical protein